MGASFFFLLYNKHGFSILSDVFLFFYMEKKERCFVGFFFHNFFPDFFERKREKFCPPVFLITLRIFASIPEPSPYTFPEKKKIKMIKKCFHGIYAKS